MHMQALDAVVPGDVVRHNQAKRGSAFGLQCVLGLGRYQTAWTWIHKLRRAMVRPGREWPSYRRFRSTCPLC